MSGILRLFGMSAVSMGLCAFAVVANAATGRGDYANVRQDGGGAVLAGASGGAVLAGANGRVGMQPNAARMPSMPILPIGVVGNITTSVPGNAAVYNNLGGNQPSGNLGGNVGPDVNAPGPDGSIGSGVDDGVCAEDKYTVENCMNHLTACINNGALPNGLNDMFNADLRVSIINGMNLCAPQVDKCINDVTRNCNKVYFSRADVWTDFNSRRVQPEYYNFVLRKTGLTPTQAENTCLLLDSNTYGSSFNRVSSDGKEIDDELGNVKQAYNAQKEGSKNNPLGVDENTDYQRGHYARWDAIEGECLVRVAAYNKDKLITNDLFGTIGDKTPAEVWKAAGSTFSCNKDLFDFGLMRQTREAAIIALPTGAGVGAAVGAGVGAARAKDLADRCDSEKYRENLWEQIKDYDDLGQINVFLGNTDLGGTEGAKIKRSDNKLDAATCKDLLNLRDIYDLYQIKIKECEFFKTGKITEIEVDEEISLEGNPSAATKNLNGTVTEENAKPLFKDQCAMLKTPNVAMKNAAPENLACSAPGKDCLDYDAVKKQVQIMGDLLANLDLDTEVKKGAEIGKGAGVGAAVGLGAAGIATGIVALIEADNIHCRVGDGLANVEYKKSYSIDNLKDLYVKHKLNLPDTALAGASTMVSDQVQWIAQCGTYLTDEECDNAQFYYKYKSVGKSGAYSTEWIYSGCKWNAEDLKCGANEVLFNSYGVPSPAQ